MITDTETIADVVVAAVRAATSDLIAKCAALEAKVGALETRAPVPGPAGEKGERGETGPKGHDGIGQPGPAGERGLDGKDAVVDVDELARKAALLVPASPAGKDGADGRDGQPGVPGVPGRDGATGERGEKGMDGKDGRDGTLEGVTVKAIDERTFELVRADGSSLGQMAFPVPLYKGVYAAGTGYVKGDSVTFGGSLWIAKESTKDKPGDGATGWQLAVKAGRDGREGKPGERGGLGPKGEKGDPGRNYS